jgi:hypothetical protein
MPPAVLAADAADAAELKYYQLAVDRLARLSAGPGRGSRFSIRLPLQAGPEALAVLSDEIPSGDRAAGPA